MIDDPENDIVYPNKLPDADAKTVEWKWRWIFYWWKTRHYKRVEKTIEDIFWKLEGTSEKALLKYRYG